MSCVTVLIIQCPVVVSRVLCPVCQVGENFKTVKGASNSALLEWTAEDVEQLYSRVRLPTEVEDEMDGVSVIALYDFQFRRIQPSDVSSLQYRASILPASQFDQCWTRADWKKHKNADPAATGVVG